MRLPKVLPAVCLTPACQQLGAEFLKNLSPNHASLDPCTDFDELVCGGWRENYQLRPEEGQATTLSRMQETVEEKLRAILEGPYPGASSHSHFSPRNLEPPTLSLDEQNFNKMQRAYNACMDEPTITELGVKPIIDILDGLQPHFEAIKETGKGADLSPIMEYMKWNGISWVLALAPGSDPRDPDRRMPNFAPRSSLSLGNRGYYFDQEIMSEYRSVLTHVLTHVHPTGADGSKEAAQWADLVVNFEIKLAEMMPEISDMRQGGFLLVHPEYLDSILPQVNIKRLIKTFAPQDYKPNKIAILSSPIYSNFSSLLNQTDKQTLEWYFNWRAIQSWEGTVIAKEVFDPSKRLYNRLTGRELDSEVPRYRKCVSHATQSMGWILSRFFIETSFSARNKDLGNEIIADLKNVYSENFDKQDWMEQSVKVFAKEKVNAIYPKIGYPDEAPNITDPSALHELYSNLTIDSSSHTSNLKSITAFSLTQAWNAIDKQVNHKEWHMYSPAVNAYYSTTSNEIAFPAGILQPPLFSADLPAYINYGGFGMIAGHELSHGFDDQGRKFDAQGRIAHWWTSSTLGEYNSRAQCFVNQFNEFTVTGPGDKQLNVIGNQTLGENIADSGGLSVSYTAWHAKYLEEREKGEEIKENLLLPGFEGTVFDSPERMFYLAFANVWCAKSSPAALLRQVLTDYHAPCSVRIKGALANSRGFLEAFNCPVKEPRCELW